MLVLERKKGESIVLDLGDGKKITVKVCEIQGYYKTRIGIEAPRDIEIMREELIKDTSR